MEYRYACDGCGTVHASNPTQCRGCGGTILKPVPTEELRSRTTGDSIPDTMDPDDIGQLGSTIEPDYESSPGVALDGSIEGESSATEPSTSTWSRNGKLVLGGILLLAISVLIFYLF